MVRWFLSLAVFTCAALLAPSMASAIEPGRWTLALELGTARLEGMPLSWSDEQVLLMARDGRLWSFEPGQARNARKQSSSFTSYSAAEMRALLTQELGKAFEVTSTGHYLVVHPRGEGRHWSGKFEEMYRTFVHYFTIRGFRPREPEFPLVAIVFKDQADFLSYSRQDGSTLPPTVLGYYSQVSNRVALFDQVGDPNSAQWAANAETIIHEVTHQTAYNTGIHRRFAGAPRWLVEGLATMFEARGVWDFLNYRDAAARINRGRLQDYRGLVSSRREGLLAEMVSSDRLFESDMNRAYAEAWALSFYLAETRGQQYSQYLQRTAARPEFSEYPAAERLADFQAVFGQNLRLLEAQYLQWMQALR